MAYHSSQELIAAKAFSPPEIASAIQQALREMPFIEGLVAAGYSIEVSLSDCCGVLEGSKAGAMLGFSGAGVVVLIHKEVA